MQCALCRKGETSEAGHIIPHFAFRHLVKTSPTRFIRGYDNPNVRLQDGKTRHFLCPNCEDILGRWEKIFAQNVFHPLHIHHVKRDRDYPTMSQFPYGEWLLKFCVSVSWRSLYDLMLDHPEEPLPHGDNENAKQALTVWREYLIGERESVDAFPQHLTIVGSPVETSGIANTSDLKLFFERGITHSTWHNPFESYVFTKLCRVIVAGTIKDQVRPWKGTLVGPDSGHFSLQEQVLSGVFTSWIRSDIAGMPIARDRLSERQSEVIDAAIKKFLSKNQGDADSEKNDRK